MKFTIDTEKIKKKGIPKDVFFHVLSLYFRSYINDDVMQEANHLGYNIKTPHGYVASKEGIEMVQNIFVDSANSEDVDDTEYEETAQALVEIFPKGFKQGTKLLWGGAVPAIAHRLKLLEYKAHTHIPKNKAVKAAMKYVESFEDDRQFMQTLPYFLFKAKRDVDGDIEWTSNFLSILESLK